MVTISRILPLCVYKESCRAAKVPLEQVAFRCSVFAGPKCGDLSTTLRSGRDDKLYSYRKLAIEPLAARCSVRRSETRGFLHYASLRSRQHAYSYRRSALVDQFQRELHHPRRERAADNACGCRVVGAACCALCSGGTAGQVVVGVIEEVVEFGTEFNFQAFHRRRKPLVYVQVKLVELR